MQLGIAGATFFSVIGVRATSGDRPQRDRSQWRQDTIEVGRNTCPMVRQCTRRPPSLIQTGYAGRLVFHRRFVWGGAVVRWLWGGLVVAFGSSLADVSSKLVTLRAVFAQIVCAGWSGGKLSWCWRWFVWRVAGFVRGLLDVAVSGSRDAATAALLLAHVSVVFRAVIFRKNCRIRLMGA